MGGTYVSPVLSFPVHLEVYQIPFLFAVFPVPSVVWRVLERLAHLRFHGCFRVLAHGLQVLADVVVLVADAVASAVVGAIDDNPVVAAVVVADVNVDAAVVLAALAPVAVVVATAAVAVVLTMLLARAVLAAAVVVMVMTVYAVAYFFLQIHVHVQVCVI